jgi:PAS domain S-box-containing protein
MDAVSDLVFFLDGGARILFANRIVLLRLGYTTEELVEKHLVDLHPVTMRPDAEACLKRMYAGSEEVCTIPLESKDGARIPVVTRIVRDLQEQSQILCAVCRDLPDREDEEPARRAAALHVESTHNPVRPKGGARREQIRPEALLQLSRLSQASVREIADFALHAALGLTGSTAGCIFITDEDGSRMRLHSCTDVLPEALGLKDRHIVLSAESECELAEPLRTGCPVIANNLAGGHREGVKGTPCTQTGIARCMAVPVFDDDGIVAVAGVVNKPQDYDRTDAEQLNVLLKGMWGIVRRNLAEESLRESEKRYRQLVENANDIIYTCDTKGKFTLINPQGCRATGYNRHEIIGKHFARLVRPDYRDRVNRFYGEQLSRKIPDTYFELPIVTKAGETVWAGQNVQLLTQGDEVVGFQSICRDITERRKTEEMLRHTERISALGQIAGGVAHNFNNLLQMVVGGCQMALAHLAKGDAEAAGKNLERILESSNWGAQTVRRLQDFARAHREAPTLQGTAFDLSKTVEEAIAMSAPWWKSAAEKDAVKITMHHDLSDGCYVRGKENELFEVTVNLIKNAVEALPKGGEIYVSTAVTDGRVMLTVRDNGIGIAKEHKAKVFDPFWTTKNPKGTGLGLAGSLGIVRMHGGGINVESDVGKGATFCVFLPLASEPERCEKVLLDPSFAFKPRILIVDDMEMVASLLEDGLTEKGMLAVTASNGQQALEILESRHVDLILCDLAMPEMNGWQVGEYIKQRCLRQGIPKPPFILLTGWGGQYRETERIEKSGVDEILNKPVEITKLLEVVRRHLSHDIEPTQES